ncbi:hypothetical protein [Cohnella kolymensis]|uniref:hypothetical protein n=1 Tax=Cohnella kolymensis TaxID=1590652 RepID=UPI00190FAACB|nr:hypothetical protein [Cohnella kolymensis]
MQSRLVQGLRLLCDEIVTARMCAGSVAKQRVARLRLENWMRNKAGETIIDICEFRISPRPISTRQLAGSVAKQRVARLRLENRMRNKAGETIIESVNLG